MNINEQDKIKLLRNKIWSVALTSGGITATVLYYISQLPAHQQVAIKAAIEAALAIK